MSGDTGGNRVAAASSAKLSIREILRLDPDLVELDTYTKAFAFLGAAEPSLNEKERKQQYLTKYRLFILLRQGLALFAISIIYCLTIFIIIRNTPYDAPLIDLFNTIPLGNVPITHSQLDSRSWAAISSSDVNRFMFTVNSLRFFWTIWLAYRLIKDFSDPGAFFSTRSIPGQYYLPEKMVAVTAFGSVVGMALILITYHGLFERNSLFAPSVFDRPIVFTLKSVSIMSLGYWVLGFSLFLIATLIRQTWSQARG